MGQRFFMLSFLGAVCLHHGQPSHAQAPAAAPKPAQGHGETAPPGHGHPHAPHAHGYDKDFSAADAYAKHFDSKERDAWQKPDEVIRLLALQPGHTVADVGTGTGYFLGPLSAAVGSGGHVLGLDTELNMVNHVKKRTQASGWTNVEARQVAGDDPGLAAASVDRILIVNTWHHISDREQYAAKLLQALRSGGAVLVVDYTRESDQGPPKAHRLPAEQVVRELQAGGLVAQVVAESLPKQYVVIGKRP
jgi:ubiquinone/menaquinone biosynthesis C-methylase UbiE